MKKTGLLMILIILSIRFVHSQTNTFPTSGFVGIGVTSPTNDLHIERALDGELTLLIKNTYGGGTRTFLTSLPNRSLIQTDRDFGIWTNGGGWSEKFTITSDGYIGMGVTTPNRPLTVYRLSPAMTLQNWRGGTNGDKEIEIGLSDAESWFGTTTTNKLKFTTNSTDRLTIDASGLIGIGTNNPTCEFHLSKSVNGELNLLIQNTYGLGTRTFLTTLPDRSLIQTDRDFGISTNGGGWSEKLTIKNNGDIGIGTVSPGYKLDVIGTIRAREIKVDLNGADFVFEKDYKLMPLNELEQFVKEQKHLPEITPAKEMEANGTDLGNLNSKLLQKMEEMTLYIIEQNKKIEALQNEIKEMKEASK